MIRRFKVQEDPMHRLAITDHFTPRGVTLAGVAALTTFLLGPWAVVLAVGVLLYTRNVTITWPSTAAPVQEQPATEEASR